MKIIKLEKKTGIASLKIDSLDDLWHLSKIIEPNDIVSSKTYRRIKIGGETERQKSVKKSIFLEVNVQKAIFDANSDTLKISGLVSKGPEYIALHSAHTLDITIGSELSIQKERWKNYQIDRLKEAEAASVAPKALICVLDDEESNFAFLTSAGPKYIGKLSLRLSKKRLEEKKKQSDIEKVSNKINEIDKQSLIDNIILGSPLFWKEIVYKDLKSRYSKLAKKVSLEDNSSGNRRGIQELIARGVLDKIIAESRASKEEKLINFLLKEISKKSNLATYGIKEVKKAISTIAIEILIVTDKLIESKRDEISKIIDSVEQSNGKVNIFSTDNEPGEKLQGLGGIAAILRYPI